VVTDDMAQRMSLLDDSSNGWLGLDIAEVTVESAQNLKAACGARGGGEAGGRKIAGGSGGPERK
jgi:hypothetical protein